MAPNISALEDYVGVEYNGHKTLIRRNPDLEATIRKIRQVFGVLEQKLPDQVILSAYIEGLGDYFIVPQSDWADLLPRVDRLSVCSTLKKPHEPKKSPVDPALTKPESSPEKYHPVPASRPTRSSSIISVSDSDEDNHAYPRPSQNSNPAAAPVKNEDETVPNSQLKIIPREPAREEDEESVGEGWHGLGGLAHASGSKDSHRSPSRVAVNDHPSNQIKVRTIWSGQTRGMMAVHKPRGGERPIPSGKWTFSTFGVRGEPIGGRGLGDIHFSPNAAGDGFDHWVIELEPYPRWVKYVGGDPHPMSSRYVLRDAYIDRPAGWITALAWYNTKKRRGTS